MKAFNMEAQDGESDEPLRKFAETFAGTILRNLPLEIQIGDQEAGAGEPRIRIGDVFDSSEEFRDSFVDASVATMNLLAVPVEDSEAVAALVAISTTSLILDMAPGLVPEGSMSAAIDVKTVVPAVTDWDRVRGVLGVSDSPFLNLSQVRETLTRKRTTDGRPNVPF